MKKLLLFCICITQVLYSMAQTRSITGSVTDKAGNPVANVSVTVKGYKQGTSTSTNGSFSLNISSNAKTLIVSSVGFADQEVPIGNGSNINIVLNNIQKQLEEVVVVAYGTQKKQEITSAISTVDADAIKQQQVTSVSQALQGTASGVLVVNSSGQPGDNPIIRIRGIASVNASADPLIVLDGVPFDGNINMISASDIDNFSVLKDATATALYGSRAANGVILINTKTGRKNTPAVISVSATGGASSRAVKEYPFLNTQQHFELGWEALKNHYGAADPDAAQKATDNLIKSAFHYNPYNIPKPVGPDGKLVAGATPLWNTDWVKELERSDAKRIDVNLGIEGGTEKTKYFLGGEYLNQEGYTITSKYERISARFNYTADLRDWLQLGIRSSIVSSNQNFPDQGSGNYTDNILYVRTLSSVFPLYERGENGELILDADGKPIYDFGNGDPNRTVNVNRLILTNSNNVATTYLDPKTNKRLSVDLNTYALVKLAPGFSYKSSFGINRYLFNKQDHDNREFGFATNVGGRTTRQSDLTTSYTWNNMLNYEKKFGDHSFSLMASYEAYRYKLESFSASKTGFPFGGLIELNNAATNESTTGSTIDETLLSYLGRLQYNYKEKYFAEFTARRDGSSRFAANNRFGFFPAGGVSWLINRESFMKSITPINLLKLRASYGVVGNNFLLSNSLPSYFPYLGTFSTGYDQLTEPGVYFTQLANENIRWEKQGNADIGLDFELFNRRLTGSIDAFNKTSIDLLFDLPLVYSGGIPSVSYNIGKIENKGIEVSLNYDIIKTQAFTWNAGINFTFLKNTIKKLTDRDTLAPSGNYRLTVGKSRYEFYLADWAGVDPADGKPMWYIDELDAQGNPTGKRITTKSAANAAKGRRYFGSAIPKISGGFSQHLSYKNFDLNILLNFALGGKYYDDNYANLMHGEFFGYGSQMTTDILKRWQKPGDITDVPILSHDNNDALTPSTRFLFSGDYLRLRNVTLGYTIPFKNQVVVKSMRVFAQADNMLTWDKLKAGSDPESGIDGTANGNSSVYKTISFGLDFSF
jgi:TonB-linked SusC/RagA family outer membrane protein